jgi:cystathionine beta-lyase/cystathionine gamma-synthase
MPLDAQIENGITDVMLRVSVGLESTADIVADLQQALA